METKDFIIAVLNRLPPEVDPLDAKDSAEIIGALQHEGFTVDEAVAYCKCMEEFNPTLDEDVALRRMTAIQIKVKSRQNAEKETAQ